MQPNSTTRTMVRNCFCLMGIALASGLVIPVAQGSSPAIQPVVTITEFPLPNAGSGPTTIAIAPDGALWFTEAAGNRIGRMMADGTGLKEFDLPHAGSSPRIITIGSDGNM